MTEREMNDYIEGREPFQAPPEGNPDAQYDLQRDMGLVEAVPDTPEGVGHAVALWTQYCAEHPSSKWAAKQLESWRAKKLKVDNKEKE